MARGEIEVVAYVDSDMVHDADDVPTREDGRTLYVPCPTGDEDVASTFGPEWKWLDELEGRARRWFLFDREGTVAERIEAARKYLL